jgi:hypothetical protein
MGDARRRQRGVVVVDGIQCDANNENSEGRDGGRRRGGTGSSAHTDRWELAAGVMMIDGLVIHFAAARLAGMMTQRR